MTAWFSSFMLHGAFAVAFIIAGVMSFREELDLAASQNVVPIEVVASAEIAAETNITPIAPIEAEPELVEEAPAAAGAPQTVQAPPQAQPDVVALPTKEKQKTPPKKTNPTPNVDLDKLAGLIDRSRKDEGRRTDNAGAAAQKGERPRAGIGSGTELTITEQDAIRAHVEKYWRAPADMPDPARLVVRVRFEVNADGSLAGQPEVVSPTGALDQTQRAAVENALRAVRVAQPLPVDKKRTERATFIMNFDPRQMAGMQ